ncbi:M48 family metallopeptidase [Vogesella facilis]|uniref:M48 family metallopeptidase n=1 Tax=Vogesella facilis TaxID=1655232 RepID=A0ABV7RJ96_9NEIS
MNARPGALTLTLPDGAVAVRLTRRQRQSVGIRVQHGEVEVIAPPGVSLAYLQEVLAQKRDWIAGHLARHREASQQQAASPDLVLYAGENLQLHCHAAQRISARVEGGALHLAGPQLELPARRQAALLAWLQREAKKRFAERLQLWLPRAARPLSGWALSSARSRWGSCSGRGVIRLNWRLVQAPPAILDYVIAHELAHLLHMNHSKVFWAEVERLYPGWQGARQWLKQHGELLFRHG